MDRSSRNIQRNAIIDISESVRLHLEHPEKVRPRQTRRWLPRHWASICGLRRLAPTNQVACPFISGLPTSWLCWVWPPELGPDYQGGIMPRGGRFRPVRLLSLNLTEEKKKLHAAAILTGRWHRVIENCRAGIGPPPQGPQWVRPVRPSRQSYFCSSPRQDASAFVPLIADDQRLL